MTSPTRMKNRRTRLWILATSVVLVLMLGVTFTAIARSPLRWPIESWFEFVLDAPSRWETKEIMLIGEQRQQHLGVLTIYPSGRASHAPFLAQMNLPEVATKNPIFDFAEVYRRLRKDVSPGGSLSRDFIVSFHDGSGGATGWAIVESDYAKSLFDQYAAAQKDEEIVCPSPCLNVPR